MVKNLPSNAGDTGLIPGQGTKMPHSAGQLSPHTLQPAHHNLRDACAPQGKIPHAATKMRCSQINK